MLMTAAAPSSKEVQDFLECIFSCKYNEAYGLTETSGGDCFAHLDDLKTGHSGGTIACQKARLRDLPEMNYRIVDPSGGNPKGELCLKGPQIFAGYYKSPEKTAEAFDDEGWFLSGDVAEIRPDGSIKIIDRVKNIFKLVQGEYVAPEKLENIFIQSNLIAQCWVHGESTKEYTIAFIVVDTDQLATFCGTHNIKAEDALESEELR